jgi:hypothetical protein
MLIPAWGKKEVLQGMFGTDIQKGEREPGEHDNALAGSSKEGKLLAWLRNS